ncbi:MAG: hypothetical protein GXX94_05755 [Chloroflexi bacterium]|nr:hypothetical protein [Chloroflexota bacterium]
MKPYGALRFISSLYRVFAWVALIAGILASLGVILVTVIGGNIRVPQAGALASALAGLPGALLMALTLAAVALLMYVALSAVADCVQLALAIEENTRATAELLKGEAALNASGTAPWDPAV